MLDTSADYALVPRSSTVADPTANGPTPARSMMVELIGTLIQQLASEGVRYCHWKSNYHLRESLAGVGDLDLLVHRRDSCKFEGVLAQLGFKRAVDPLRPHMPSVSHWYGLDRTTGKLIHLHVYYRLVTGESLLKNYRLPLEELVLDRPDHMEGMPKSRPAAELIVFTIRAILKCSPVTEHILMSLTVDSARTELAALLAATSVESATELLRRWMPSVEPRLFQQCVACLRDGRGWSRRMWLARRMRKQLRSFARFPPLEEAFLRMRGFLAECLYRLFHRRGSRHDLASGGVVIAFVGPDASGKSTLVRETSQWLRQAFRVCSGHLGKPPSTWLTLLPNLALRLTRLAFPERRRSRTQTNPQVENLGAQGLMYTVRDLILAWDRRAWALRLRRKAAKGWIVLCDRHPSDVAGAADSPRLTSPNGGPARTRFHEYLINIENQLYRQIPPPDVVIRLSAPVDVAVQRNRHRKEAGKDKSDAYVAIRHANAILPSFVTTPIIELDTNRSKSETIETAYRTVWSIL